MKDDLELLSVPLPEEVLQAKYVGDFTKTLKIIAGYLQQDIPQILHQRLLLEKEVLARLAANEYVFTLEQAQQKMATTFVDYQADELDRLLAENLIDWQYREGIVHLHRRFVANLIKTQPTYANRQKERRSLANVAKRRTELDENIRLMKENGERTVKIRMKSSIHVKKEFERLGETVRVHLPLPLETREVSNITVLKTSPELSSLAPADAAQRTIFFETPLTRNQEFSIEYEFTQNITYVELDEQRATSIDPNDFSTELSEQLPHIRFTPYLKAILAEIVGDEQNPIKKARAIYEFITKKVRYSFVRDYFTIANLSEYAAVNLKGDCGVQAILFITLCRMTGIPAKWQSGLYVSASHTGSHDWAQFYVAPYGWVFADPSFGGSAYREGNQARWQYYFGNLDVYRMPANSAIDVNFVPKKRQLRADPVDNQRGEIEYRDGGLSYAQVVDTQEFLGMTEC
jgi:transglutaminase-like putative cysteine protease